MGNVVSTKDYMGPDRRHDDRREGHKTLVEIEQYIDDRFAEHEVKEQIWISQLQNTFADAFPNGDLDGHRNYHQNRINAAKAEEEFWKTAKTEVVKHGVSAVFTVVKGISILAILGLAYKFGLGPAAAKFLGFTVS